MTPQPGDVVEVTSLMHYLMLTCWPYGVVVDVAENGRVYVAMTGDFVSRSGGGTGCRLWHVDEIKVVYRPENPFALQTDTATQRELDNGTK